MPRAVQSAGKRHDRLALKHSAALLILRKSFTSAAEPGEQSDDTRVAVLRQWIGPNESTRMHERLFRTVAQLIDESAKRTETESAEGRTLGETPLLVAITGRQIQTVQELATIQTERCLQGLRRSFRHVGEQITNGRQVDYGIASLKGDTGSVGLETHGLPGVK